MHRKETTSKEMSLSELDTIVGGDGNDIVLGEAGSDLLVANEGREPIVKVGIKVKHSV